MSTPTAMEWHLPADHVLHRVRRGALGSAVLGGLCCAVGLVLDREQFLRSWLVAFVFWTGGTAGCLAILMIHHVTGGAWGVAIRRLLEAGTRNLPLMAIAFLPIALGLPSLYEWARPEAVARDHLLQHKQLYLNVPFFLARTVLYFMAWITIAAALRRWSLHQDTTPDPAPADRLELISRGGLLLMGLTMTFASFDWMMSLEPHWGSTIYGVLFMGGSVLTAFALVIPMAAALADRAPVSSVIQPAQFHDLGKLLLAFVMLWAYFSFSQFIIIYAANLPEEIGWYLVRTGPGWHVLVLLLVVFHFAQPFVILLSRDTKRRARRLGVVAIFLVVMRFLDVFWLIVPAFHPEHLTAHWLDLAAMVALGGVWVAHMLGRLEGAPVIPLRDLSLPVLEA